MIEELINELVRNLLGLAGAAGEKAWMWLWRGTGGVALATARLATFAFRLLAVAWPICATIVIFLHLETPGPTFLGMLWFVLKALFLILLVALGPVFIFLAIGRRTRLHGGGPLTTYLVAVLLLVGAWVAYMALTVAFPAAGASSTATAWLCLVGLVVTAVAVVGIFPILYVLALVKGKK